MRHHTKDKGDLGVGQVLADLISNGIQVALPLSEHQPYDLIASAGRFGLRRVQVRYRTSNDAAHVQCDLGGSWADRHGTHKRPFDPSAIDVLALFCPSPRTFVYLLVHELPSRGGIHVRLSKAKNNQVKRIRDASDFRDPWRMFELATPSAEHPSVSGTVADATPP